MKHKAILPKKRQGLLDWLVYFGAVVEPIMTVPQIYEVWVQNKPAGSLLTWFSYVLFAFIWLLYGIKYKIKPLIITEVLWVLLQGLVVIGIVLKK